ncbi:hypothetical protein HPP92_022715 [Vanilla planifolia]|uniref:Uncharacterized protein n=1 Tax=Vanilla planifolia TaxID=51239 RepID=A0A835UE27_VANPL|nr:hypothetical protein HPP92_023010 [Vanilla planifolia]KAG0459587.1 hypothetical protein HPP92_022715 [Vanilla planifolia]
MYPIRKRNLYAKDKKSINLVKTIGELFPSNLPRQECSPSTSPMATAEAGMVRVKLVIRKQELKELLRKEGVSVADLLPELLGGQNRCGGEEGDSRSLGWCPSLESIPEGNDL